MQTRILCRYIHINITLSPDAMVILIVGDHAEDVVDFYEIKLQDQNGQASIGKDETTEVNCSNVFVSLNL